jgi:hypothetical protein
MATEVTAVSSEQNTLVSSSNVWLLAGLILAGLVNAAWIGFLGYCIVSLII